MQRIWPILPGTCRKVTRSQFRSRWSFTLTYKQLLELCGKIVTPHRNVQVTDNQDENHVGSGYPWINLMTVLPVNQKNRGCAWTGSLVMRPVGGTGERMCLHHTMQSVVELTAAEIRFRSPRGRDLAGVIIDFIDSLIILYLGQSTVYVCRSFPAQQVPLLLGGHALDRFAAPHAQRGHCGHMLFTFKRIDSHAIARVLCRNVIVCCDSQPMLSCLCSSGA